jgi:hypothetical protein
MQVQEDLEGFARVVEEDETGERGAHRLVGILLMSHA